MITGQKGKEKPKRERLEKKYWGGYVESFVTGEKWTIKEFEDATINKVVQDRMSNYQNLK